MSTLSLAAYAKINLALDILGKRSDGYHEVEMVMQAVGLHDVVELEPREAGISLTCDRPELSCDKDNLAYRAAELLREECGVAAGAHITLTKRIPLAAGLAGGSSDAAAVLRGLNALWRVKLSTADLENLAARLGSDVPFCLWGGTAVATGRGEKLSPLPDFDGLGVVLVHPPFPVETAWVYGRYSAALPGRRPDIPGLRTAIARRDLPAAVAAMGNRLEAVTIPAYPQIASMKNALLAAGACGVMMSGSGPTVFALTPDRASAAKLADCLSLPAAVSVTSTETVAREEPIHVA